MNTLPDQAYRLLSLVDQTRDRLLRYALLRGAGMLLAGLTALLLLAAAIDLLFPLPEALRLLALTLLLLTGSLLLVLTLVIPYLKRPDRIHCSTLIERKLPHLRDRLITLVDLEQSPDADPPPSDFFLTQLIEQTGQHLSGYRVHQVADPRPALLATASAGLLLVAALLLCIGFPDYLPIAIQRIIQPTAPISPASYVRYQADPGSVAILQGEPLTLRAIITRGQPQALELHIRPAPGAPWARYPMAADDQGKPSFTLTSVNSPYQYRLVGGGTWTPTYDISLLQRPVIQATRLAVQLPAYMGITQPRPVEENTTQISAPVASQLLVEVQAANQVQTGYVQLLKALSVSGPETSEIQTPWIDQRLPEDAQTTGVWNWTPDRAHPDRQLFTFNWARQPFGFSTKLNPLVLAPEAELAIRLQPDAQDPPPQLVLTLVVEGKSRKFLWDSPAMPRRESQKKDHQYVGPLPPAGSWTSLVLPASAILGSPAKQSQRITGLSLAIPKGKILFERVSAVERTTRNVTVTKFQPEKQVPLLPNPDKQGLWQARVPVLQDAHFTLHLFNAQGHANLPTKPMPILAVADQPPTLLVEKPGRSITIPTPDPLPLTVRAFDDFGIQSVGLQVGSAEANLGQVQWLAQPDQPQTTTLTTTSLQPRTLNLKPGESVWYRLVALDRKGQQAHSETYRLSLAAPQAAAAPSVAAPPAPLDPILSGLTKLLAIPVNLVNQAVQQVPELEAHKAISPDGTVKLLRPDGSAMTAEDLRKVLESRFAELSDQQKKQLLQLEAQLTEQRRQTQELARQLQEAAQKAQQSPLSLPMETQSLQALADLTRQLADQPPAKPAPGDKPDAQALERLAKLLELSPQQQAELQQLQQRVQELQAARDKLAQQPEGVGQQMAALMAQLQAQQVNRQVDQLQDQIQNQQQKLQQMRQQLAQLQQQAAKAQAPQLDQVSKEQAKLDAQALEAIKRARELALSKLADPAAADPLGADPLEPWSPPGKREQAMPVERDTPEENPAKPSAKDANKTPADKPKPQPEEARKDWWDQPVNAPPTPTTLEENARLANRDNRPVESPKPKPADPNAPAATPRQQLQQHQDAMAQRLTENSNDAAAAQSQLEQLQRQLQGLAAQVASNTSRSPQGPRTNTPNSPAQAASPNQAPAPNQTQAPTAAQASPPGQAQNPAQAQAQNPAQAQGQAQGQAQAQTPPAEQSQAQGQAQAQAQAIQQLQQILQSAQVQQAMLSAARAAAMQQADTMTAMAGQAKPANPTGNANPNSSGPAARPGTVMMLDMPAGNLPANQAAGLYRLPPQVRQPLLQAMQERGPQAYQPLIDAYYRELSKDLK